MGNNEFASAARTIENVINELNCKEAENFMTDFFGEYSKTLDELSI